MGWFDEQVKQRIQGDDRAFSDAILGVADIILGQGKKNGFSDRAKNSIDAILKFYNLKSTPLPDDVTDFDEQLEYLMHSAGVMRRAVHLEGSWYKNAVGAYLGFLQNGDVVALLPGKFGGYYYDYGNDKKVKVNQKNVSTIKVEAISFYKPLPLKKLGIKDLLIYIVQTLSLADYLVIGLATFVITLLGMLTPQLNKILFSTVIETKSIGLMLSVGVMMITSSIAMGLINIVNIFFNRKIQIKTSTAVEAAAMMRTFSLPAKFFGEYSTGEIASRSQSIDGLCNMLVNMFFGLGLSSIFSLIYIAQVFAYTPALVLPSICVTIATLAFSTITTIFQIGITQKKMALSAKEMGLTYELVNGIQKIKLSGSEKRVFTKWANLYGEKAEVMYNPPLFLKINGVITSTISIIGTVILYNLAVHSNVTVANYLAFNAAYGMVAGAFTSLSGLLMSVANIKPVFDMVKPILETVPEVSLSKKIVTRLFGGIEISNVSFRYAENMPMILEDLSLKITPGQYVAIVGKTGCGKSTLLRLLLGFETPQKGAVFYDDKDTSAVDFQSIRQRMGVVMQNSKLISADIFTNIAIATPYFTLEKAWEAAELAGIAEDIRKMPMGMHTLIGEGSGGISGGQRQRIMIARAIAAKPKILLLDEATSALDNITQKAVTESLARLKCTRIVIAHRLSTIKECDRILLLENGHIVEDGTYNELIALNGQFAELVEQQRIKSNES